MGARPDSTKLENQLAFETLISDLSARLVAASDQALGSVIETGLEDAARFFGADCGRLGSVVARQAEVRVLHAWHAHALESSARQPSSLGLETTPWVAGLVVTGGQPLALSTLEALPPEAHRDRASLAARGVRSAVWLPIAIGSDVRFILAVESTHSTVQWHDWAVERLQRLGEILAHFIERQRAADESRDANARNTLAILSADAGAWDWDPGTGHIWATPAARALYGLDADADIMLDTFLSVIHPEDLDYVRQRLPETVAGADFKGEYRVVLPGGTVRWVSARGRRHQPADGSPAHVLGLSVDVTARRLEEAEHRANAAHLQASIEAAGLGFYVMYDKGVHANLDERTRELLGLPRGQESTVRGFWIEHIHPDDRERVLALSGQVISGATDHVSAIYRYRHPTRGVLWLQHTTQTFERDGTGWAGRVAGVLRDLTEEKRAEEDLRTLSRHLIQAQETERTVLARDLHDDVTQRLAVLAIELGRAESTAEGGVSSEMLRTVREGLVRLSEDVHSLAYRLHPAVLEELGLVDALRTECERRGRHGSITITPQLEQVPATVAKDATLCLYRVAQEALHNVYRHAHATKVTVVLRQADGGTMLAIRDDGVGFEPAERGARGSLGLVGMRERLRLVDGTLDIDSAPGHGTVIIAWVPGSGAAQPPPGK
jgi:signal transduction histidine kinase